MARIPAPNPEGLSRLLQRNVGFLTPALWIAFLSLIAIDSRQLENDKGYSELRAYWDGGQDFGQDFFHERRSLGAIFPAH
jgi:hypothetical protein